MLQEEDSQTLLKDYKSVEVDFHTELMNVCKKYVHRLDTISILGIMDIVKTETIEFEKATKHYDKNPDFQNENPTNAVNDFDRL